MDASESSGKCRERGIFKLVLNSLPVGIIVFDKLGLIIEVNPAAERLTGYSREQLVGKCCGEIGGGLFDMITPPVAGDETVYHPDTTKEGTQVKEAVLVKKSGERIPILYFDSALLDEENHICGMVKMFRDISAEKRMHKKHRILISMFAHDLKAPVAIAGGFLSRLLKGKAGELNDKQLRYLNVIENELKKLDSHIHSFLDILRMEAGEITLSLEKCSLEKIIYDITEEFEEKASSKNIRLVVNAPEQNVIVMVDKEQIERVLTNLIDNAIKYSPENTTIYITVEDHKGYVTCSVRDEGPGIPEEDIPYIFDPFYRSASAEKEKKDSDGTGIGLAIVKSIIEAHKGEVWVASKEGQGTTITFSIPKIPENGSSL